METKEFGWLTPLSESEIGGRAWFLCRCRCGRHRDVLRQSLWAGSVTACGECTAAGRGPRRRRGKRRLAVTVDDEVLAALGLDPSAATGAELRRLLRRLAGLSP